MVVASYDLERGAAFEWHAHPVHQLSVASDGVLSMGVAGRGWVLPRSRGLWIPAQTRHTVGCIGDARMTTLWFDPSCCPITWLQPTVVEVDDLVAALVERLDDDGLTRDARARSESVLYDVLHPVATDVIDLPLPLDDRARRVADSLRADPADGRTLVEWGRAVGASDRTLMRAFVADTGFGFHEWRTRARIAAALPQLASGASVARVATSVGYASSSAFGSAFHRTGGVTPTAYFGVSRT